MFNLGDIVEIREPNLHNADPGQYRIISLSLSHSTCVGILVSTEPALRRYRALFISDLIPFFCPFPLPSKLERLI